MSTIHFVLLALLVLGMLLVGSGIVAQRLAQTDDEGIVGGICIALGFWVLFADAVILFGWLLIRAQVGT